jgi:hypothetical protein
MSTFYRITINMVTESTSNGMKEYMVHQYNHIYSPIRYCMTAA